MKAAITLLVVGILSFASQTLQSQLEPNFSDGCYPQWGYEEHNSRPNCNCDDFDKKTLASSLMTCWKGMIYVYIPKKMPLRDVQTFCGNWDEAVCKGEYIGKVDQQKWQTTGVSIVLEHEMEKAVIPAFKKACITPKVHKKHLFWTGYRKFQSGSVYYRDGNSGKPSGHTVSSVPDGDCVAVNGDTGKLEVVSCREQLPVMCKIQPPTH